MQEIDEVKKKISELLARQKWAEARELLRKLPAPDIGDFLPDLDKANRVLLFRLLPRLLAAEVFFNSKQRKWTISSEIRRRKKPGGF